MRAALVLALTAVAACGAAAAASPSPAAEPTRLWYRVTAEATIHQIGDFVYPPPEQHVLRLAYRLESRTAVLLYRQCISLAPGARTDPKLLAQVITITRTTVTCAAVRRRLRRAGMSAATIRKLRLVDDVRLTANARGALRDYERRIDVLPHDEATPAGAPVDCPSQSVDILRPTTFPVEIGGRLSTASAARDGVLVGARGTTKPIEVESGSEGGACVIRATGRPWLVPRLVTGRSSSRALFGAYGNVPVPSAAAVRFRLGTRFGRSFTVESRDRTTEQTRYGPRITLRWTKLRFTPCPRGGRVVRGC